MRLKVLLLLLILVIPLAQAATYKFSRADEPVTGHTVYVRHIVQPRTGIGGNGLPTDFAAVAGYFRVEDQALVAVQRECVVWFDGHDLDDRPKRDPNGGGNGFPSDEQASDGAAQDYDFDRDVQGCAAQAQQFVAAHTGAFAIVVERGDCDPLLGRDWIFRGHLDFVDPNNMYHEVQEFSYVCPFGGPGNVAPNPAFPGQAGGWSEALRDLLPADIFPDPDRHCNQVPPPHEEIDVENRSVGHPEQWVFCNARIQGLFREMAWMTPIHADVWDPTIQDLYNFALQIDTCDGRDCTDGSRGSFDDTTRTRVSHKGPPADEAEVMRGNSYDYDPDSESFGTHRTNCRAVVVRWQKVQERPGLNGKDCYPEDHRSAAIDIYVTRIDPTGGLWTANSHGMTGANAYSGMGRPTGPGYTGHHS